LAQHLLILILARVFEYLLGTFPIETNFAFLRTDRWIFTFYL